MCKHRVHPTAEFPAIYVVSCRKIFLTRDFYTTTGEAQEADYESVKICPELFLLLCEGSRLLGNTAGCSSQPPASLLSLQLSPIYLPHNTHTPFFFFFFFFCTVLGDILSLCLCILQMKQKLTIFIGVCSYCLFQGSKFQPLVRSCTQLLLLESYSVFSDTLVESHRERKVK